MEGLPALGALQVEPVLAGGGEMGARMREIDWSRTPLGPVEAWPQSLKTCVRIVLTSRQPMFVWWGPELINLYNDAYKSIVGGKHPQALGQPAAQVWHEIWDEVGPRAAQTMSGNEGTYDEALLLIMERNGYPEETYYTFSYSPVPDDGGGTGGLICANTDDTLRVIGERQVQVLRDLAARAPDLLTPEDACRHAALSLEREQRDVPFALVYLSDASGTTFSLAGASGVTKGHEAAPPSVSAQSTWPYPIARILEARDCVTSDLDPALGPLPKGAWDRPPTRAVGIRIGSGAEGSRSGILILGLNPFRLFDESYRGFVVLVASQIGASIGVAQAYEEERRRAESLAELDRAKTAFFSNVSHEFRTPLTLILGPIEDALRSPPLSLAGESLNAVHRNALRLLKLVNSLLDFSRIEAGRARAAFRPTDLPALTADLSSTFRSAIERAGLELRTHFEPLDEPVYVDHDMWENLVLNLLSNALKFTFEGSIEVRLQRDGKEVELSVADSGVGIAEEALPNVFKRFHRVQGARSRTHEGSGIGLALVHELARLHGGAVAVKSQVGLGTTFSVRIPLGSAHLPLDQLAEASATNSALEVATPFVQEALRWLSDGSTPLAPPASTALSLPTKAEAPAPHGREASNARILVVDDNADMREYVTRLLSPRFELEAVGDGAAALAAIRRQRPALVLSDVMMPNLDGFGLLRELRADPQTASLPVILLSARAGEEASVEGLSAGADDYLVKPFSARELLARVVTHLQIASLRAAAEAESAKLHAVFMQAPVPVALLSGDELRYDVANAPYCELVGRDVVGKTLRECYPEIADHPVFATLEGVYRSGQAVHDPELCIPLIRHGSKCDAYFNYVAQPLRDVDGKIAGIVIVAIDVTEQITSRERVNELRAAAERASRAKDEFLTTLSHELRTPLSAIVGWASLLLTGNVATGQRQTALEAIERNARAQARLIEDMLDLSRIEQGKVVLRVEPVEVIRVVEAALDAVRPAAEAKGIRLQPVLDSRATIVGDPDRLQQVVWNLLSNAIKFTPKEGRVQVSLGREKSWVYVSVADNGQGIAEAFLPYVFDRFRQGDAAFSRRAGGLGLGLAIVRSLVELHGGTVGARSDGVGQGATFVVRLPTAPLLADRQTPTETPSSRRPARFECPPELRGLRTLVVDDEPDTRTLLCFLLDQCQAKVTSVASPSEALSLLETQQFDVLVSDVGMPEMDGHEFLRRVRKLPAHANGRIPAIALTAYARAEDRTEALRAGFNMHLAKPIEPAELVVVVATVAQYQRRATEP